MNLLQSSGALKGGQGNPQHFGALVRENHRTSSSYFSWNQIKLDHNLKIRSWNQYSKQIISSASMVILCYGACHFGRAQAGSGVDVRGSSS